MNYLRDYQLFLFDFDGLLVNTEELQMEAYRHLIEGEGYAMPWDFAAYCRLAHSSATAVRETLYRLFPDLNSDWPTLYEKKCALYSALLSEGKVALMPGAADLLQALEAGEHKRAVVTHSRSEHLHLIREQLPQLNSIPHWVTREDYSRPKPDPECYQLAINRLASGNDRVIGFEDTPRGLRALLGTRAQAVFVAKDDYPLLHNDVTQTEGVIHLTDLGRVLN